MESDLDDYKLDIIFEDETLVRQVRYRSNREHGGRGTRTEEEWRWKKRLGNGGFGEVSLHSNSDGSDRAVKAILKSRALTENVNYREEIRTLTKFSRSKYTQRGLFVEFLGWYENDQFMFLAMEYMELGDLQSLKSIPKSEADLKTITEQLLEGLEMMHDNGFMHRDLKPQNIFVKQRNPWWIKIGDFGITKRTNCRLEDTGTCSFVGSRGYYAPEVDPELAEILGLRAELTGRSIRQAHVYSNAVDIWSLGCVLYELIAQKVPLSITELEKFCKGQLQIPLESLRGLLSEDGIDLIESFLKPQPQSRPSASQALRSSWVSKVTLEMETPSQSIHLEPFEQLNDQIEASPITTPLYDSVGSNLRSGPPAVDTAERTVPGLQEPVTTTSEETNETNETNEPLWRFSETVETDTRGSEVSKISSPMTSLQTAENATHTALEESAVKATNVARIFNKILLIDRRDAQRRDKIVNTALLQAAVAKGDEMAVKSLLLKGADPDKLDDQGWNALHTAVLRGDVPITRHLLASQKVTVDVRGGPLRMAAIHLAARSGSLPLLKALLRAGVAVSKQAGDGNYALHLAALYGHEDIFTYLLDYTIVPLTRNGKGDTALHLAAGRGSPNSVRRSLEHCARWRQNIDVKNMYSNTPLHSAVGSGHEIVVEMLLKSGADVNIQGYEGLTPLMRAAGNGHQVIIKLLLDSHADVNARSCNGQTALMKAALRGHENIARLLLEKGAWHDKKDLDGRTASDLAASKGHERVAQLLRPRANR